MALNPMVTAFLCLCVGPVSFLGLMLRWYNLGISQHCDLLFRELVRAIECLSLEVENCREEQSNVTQLLMQCYCIVKD